MSSYRYVSDAPTSFCATDYEAICCDIGGVLFYDFPIELAFSYYFHQCVVRHRQDLALDPWDIIDARGHHAGALKRLDVELWELANHAAWASVLEEWHLLFHPIPTALATLAKLGAQRIALVANQPTVALAVLQEHGIVDLVEFVFLDTLYGISKPDVRFFAMAISRLGVQPHQVLMVGDRIDNDIEPAKKLGMAAVWTEPLVYDPALPVPQVPESWRKRYEIGRPLRVRQALAACNSLPTMNMPNARISSLSLLCADAAL